MYQIDILSRTPVYEQIVEQTEQFVLKGILKPGDQLPSVRSLSLQLTVNPNTIAKAYAELERRGITVGAAGRGCFVRDNISPALHQYREKKLTELRSLVQELLDSGLSREELTTLLSLKENNPHD